MMKFWSHLVNAPGRNYLKRYVDHEVKRIRDGVPHRTLGSKPLNSGLLELEALVQLGLKPYHRVVDYGCGSLRLGRYLAPFLGVENYWALDITDKFYLAALGSGYISAGNWPSALRFSVISRRTLKSVRDWCPQIVLVLGVLQCVPPSQLAGLMFQLGRICVEHTQVLVTLLEADETIEFGPFAFRHSMDDVRAAAYAAQFQVRTLRQGTEPERIRRGLLLENGEDRASVLLLTPAAASSAGGHLGESDLTRLAKSRPKSEAREMAE